MKLNDSDTMFGLPGIPITDLTRMVQADGVRVISLRHEQHAGNAAAAADPLRVIPSIMLGSAVTGALSEAFGVSVRAPHGGIFVLFAVHNILGYLIALVVGVVVGAVAVMAAKTLLPAKVAAEDLVAAA